MDKLGVVPEVGSELAAEAHKLLGQGDGQAAASVWAAVTQIHAVLAFAAATAVGTSSADSRAWADVAGTRFQSGLQPDRIPQPPEPVQAATEK